MKKLAALLLLSACQTGLPFTATFSTDGAATITFDAATLLAQTGGQSSVVLSDKATGLPLYRLELEAGNVVVVDLRPPRRKWSAPIGETLPEEAWPIVRSVIPDGECHYWGVPPKAEVEQLKALTDQP